MKKMIVMKKSNPIPTETGQYDPPPLFVFCDKLIFKLFLAFLTNTCALLKAKGCAFKLLRESFFYQYQTNLYFINTRLIFILPIPD